MKTLKQEEIYCNQYADFEELSQHLEEFIGALQPPAAAFGLGISHAGGV
jgi:hypothetical protein